MNASKNKSSYNLLPVPSTDITYASLGNIVLFSFRLTFIPPYVFKLLLAFQQHLVKNEMLKFFKFQATVVGTRKNKEPLLSVYYMLGTC